MKLEFCPATIVRPVKFICLPIPKRFAALAADCSRLCNYVFEAFNCFAPYWCYFFRFTFVKKELKNPQFLIQNFRHSSLNSLFLAFSAVR